MTTQAKYLPGYGEKYLVRSDGSIYRDKNGVWIEVSQSGDPPRVRLYQNGTVERPLVKTVFERAFDE